MNRQAQVRGIAAAVLAAAVVAGCTSGQDSQARSSGATPATSSASVSALASRSAPLMPPPGADPLPEATADRLQAVIDDWVAGENNIGMTAAVVTAEGVWQGAAGRDGAGVDLVPESAMAISGMTNTFVAAEVMRLVGLGLVDLDAPVVDYVSVPFDAKGATVRQVLAMRSGFPLDPIRAVWESAAEDLDRSWTIAEAIALADADGVRQGAMGLFDYNNLNYLVLGQMVEQVAGQPWAQALTRDLIEPAGLDRVWVQDAQQPQPPLTVAEEHPRLDVVDDDGPWLPSRSVASSSGSAAGMAADAPSVARWGYLLYGGHVIDSTLVEQMTRSQGSGDEDDGWYGLGTGVGVRDGKLWVGHSGDIVSYHGDLNVVPSDSVAIAVLVPAPSRNAVVADVVTWDVPPLLLEALQDN